MGLLVSDTGTLAARVPPRPDTPYHTPHQHATPNMNCRHPKNVEENATYGSPEGKHKGSFLKAILGVEQAFLNMQ